MANRFAEQAAEDFYLIYEFGKAEFGERAADIYASLMLDAAQFAAENPLASPQRSYGGLDVRVRYFGSHVLVYVYDNPDVLVVRVLHQAADWQEQI